MPLYKVRLRDRDTGDVTTVDVPARAPFEAAILAKPANMPSVIVESVTDESDPERHPSPQHPAAAVRATGPGIASIIVGVTIANLITVAVLVAITVCGAVWLQSKYIEAVRTIEAERAAPIADDNRYTEADDELWRKILDEPFSTREEQIAEFRRRSVIMHQHMDRESAAFKDLYAEVFFGPDRARNTSDDPNLPSSVLWTIFEDRQKQRTAGGD